MDANEILVRTMNAAKEARNQGFNNTADAFDEIVEKLLELSNSRAQFVGEKRANTNADVLQVH